MAFNPFSSFWKYKRAWMASVLLLTMVTFVLCTGTGGDLMDRLTKVLMPGGTNVFSVDGRKYTNRDLEDLVQQRKLANEFMKQSYLMSANAIRHDLEQPPKGVDKDKELEEQKLQSAMYSRLTFFGKKPFFGNLNTMDSAVEHYLWLAEADRLRIELDDRAVEELWRIFTLQFGEQAKPLPKSHVIYAVQGNMGRGQASEKAINQALREEFRIWIAKRSLLKEFMQDRPTMDLMVRYDQGMDQIFDFFQKKRSSVNIALIPIQLQELAKAMPTPPKETIQKAFNDFHKNPFQPDSENWSLGSPPQARFAILTADPSSERFRSFAQATIALETHPIAALSPIAPMSSAFRLAGGTPILDAASLERLNTSRITASLEGFSTVGAGTFNYRWPIYNYLAGRSEPAVASRVAASAFDPIGGLVGFWAHAPKDALTKKDRKSLIDEAEQLEVRRRVPVFASLVARAASGREAVTTPLVLDGLNMKALDADGREHSPLLPMNLLRSELRDSLVKEQATRLAQLMMITLRNNLQSSYVKAGVYDADKLEDSLNAFFKKYGREGFKLEETSKFYSKVNVHEAPELKPLYNTFRETLPYFNSGNELIRGAPFFGLKKLDDDQFSALFFENNEFYCANQPYRVCFWPPRLSRDKASAEHQLLLRDVPDTDFFAGLQTPLQKIMWNQAIYWRVKSEEAASASAAKLDFDRQDETYKKSVLLANMVKARDEEGLKLARDIAEQLILASKDYARSVATLPEGKKGTSDPITLSGVAPWMPVRSQGTVDYRKYAVDPKSVPYARPDLAGQLLSLNEPSEPFTIKQEALDALNKSLLELAEKTHGGQPGKVIQIVTNKPRDTYYVAVVTSSLPARMDEFRSALAGTEDLTGERNVFMFRYRVDFGKEFTARFVDQLKRDHKYKALDADVGQKMFKGESAESDIEDF